MAEMHYLTGTSILALGDFICRLGYYIGDNYKTLR